MYNLKFNRPYRSKKIGVMIIQSLDGDRYDDDVTRLYWADEDIDQDYPGFNQQVVLTSIDDSVIDFSSYLERSVENMGVSKKNRAWINKKIKSLGWDKELNKTLNSSPYNAYSALYNHLHTTDNAFGSPLTITELVDGMNDATNDELFRIPFIRYMSDDNRVKKLLKDEDNRKAFRRLIIQRLNTSKIDSSKLCDIVNAFSSNDLIDVDYFFSNLNNHKIREMLLDPTCYRYYNRHTRELALDRLMIDASISREDIIQLLDSTLEFVITR